MKSNNSQAMQNSDNEGLEKTSSAPTTAQAALYRCLDLATSLMSKDLTVEAVAFWKETLEGYSAEKIERAFREHLRTSEFFPKPAEILELIHGYQAEEAPTLVEKVRKQVRQL